MSNLKDINIGVIVKLRMEECSMSIKRAQNYFKCSEEEILFMLSQDHIDTEKLLKWSKLLEYDFFRLYTQHLILYAPPGNSNLVHPKKSGLPRFRKNIYTKEIISFVIEMINTGKKTKGQVIEEYNIPKTTLYKWLDKYKND